MVLPGALADTEQPPVRGDAHADYQADAGAILRQGLSYDPNFQFDFAYKSASLYELFIPAPTQTGTQGVAAPTPAVLSVQHVQAGRLTVYPRTSPSMLLFTQPEGLGIDSLPVEAPREPAHFAAQLLAPVVEPGSQADVHDLQLTDTLHYTIQGFALDQPLRAHAQGDVLALVTRGAVSAADKQNVYAYELASSPGGERVLLVQAQGAVVQLAGQGLTAVLQAPGASLAAGGALVADVQGQQVGAGQGAGVASSQQGLTLDAAGKLTQSALGPKVSQASGGGSPGSQGASFGSLSPSAAAAGAAVGGAVALAAVGLAAAFATGKYGVFSVLAPLYARLQNEEILSNGTREAMYRFIMEHPGVNVSEVVKHFTLGWGATVYHLRVLERNHLIVASKQGRQVCYFQNGGRYAGKMAGIGALRNVNAALVARTVIEHPNVGQRDLCKLTALAQPTVSWHLQRLEEAGLVQGDAAARRHYTALPALHELAQRGLVPGMVPAVPAPSVQAASARPAGVA